jgi:hypothetical protein
VPQTIVVDGGVVGNPATPLNPLQETRSADVQALGSRAFNVRVGTEVVCGIQAGGGVVVDYAGPNGYPSPVFEIGMTDEDYVAALGDPASLNTAYAAGRVWIGFNSTGLPDDTLYFAAAGLLYGITRNSVPAHVLAGPRLTFALDPVRPNPSRGGTLTVRFSLPTDAPARLELLDVAGRRIASHEVGVGQHTLDLGAGQHLAPGLYLVRLTQGANTRTTRVAVLR